MLTIYLNTTEKLFLDANGNEFSDNNPELSVGGKEEVHLFLKSATPDWGTAAASPANWPADTSWSEKTGISAMLTVDSDYRHYMKGTLSEPLNAGETVVRATFSDASDFPMQGVVRLYQPDGDSESMTFTTRVIAGKDVTFTLGTPAQKSYDKGFTIDCQTSPLAQAYLDADQSDWGSGELVFNLLLDSVRLRDENDYSNQKSVSILGMEFLLYAVDDESHTQILRAFLLDTATLNNVQGTPGVEAPLPDQSKDYIAAEVGRSVEKLAARSIPEIGKNGTWIIDGEDTGVKAEGPAAGFGNVSADISMIQAGAVPRVETETAGPDTKKDILFKFFLPEGTGQNGGGVITGKILFDMTGSLADRVFYDEEKKYFTYLTTSGDLYVKLSDASGDWSDPVHIAPVRGVDYWTEEDKETIKDEMLNTGW